MSLSERFSQAAEGKLCVFGKIRAQIAPVEEQDLADILENSQVSNQTIADIFKAEGFVVSPDSVRRCRHKGSECCRAERQ